MQVLRDHQHGTEFASYFDTIYEFVSIIMLKFVAFEHGTNLVVLCFRYAQ
jgi:hypothetical protein